MPHFGSPASRPCDVPANLGYSRLHLYILGLGKWIDGPVPQSPSCRLKPEFNCTLPESSIEILGRSAADVTYRQYVHRAPLAFRAVRTLPQPSAFAAMVNGFDRQCPCCRREFADAQG